MPLQFEGQVALRFAEEGAHIIAVDLCDQIESVCYPMARPEDLDETVNLVEKTGRRIAAKHGAVGLMRYFAVTLAEKNIRINSVHPTGVGTPMILNDPVARYTAETCCPCPTSSLLT